MRGLRALIWLTVLGAAIVAVVMPVVWIYTGNTLPNALESAADIELHLRQSIESERLGMQANVHPSQRRPIKWKRPEILDYPKRLVALFINETGCPTYFRTEREEGFPWMKRIFARLVQGRELDGDGSCELNYARLLARRLGAKTPLQQAVASDRIHRFLQRDQIVAFNLASMQFEPGLVGVADAARDIMGKELSELSDAEMAELQLAIPPYDYWEDIRQCRNAPMLRGARDTLLRRLEEEGLLSEEATKTAIAQPVRCLSVKR